MLVSIDPFYDIQFYNRCKSSLGNNKCDFREFISYKPPYNWFIDVPEKPVMLDFLEANRLEKTHLISVVKPIRTQDYWKYYRRGNDDRQNIKRFIFNDAFEEALNSSYSAFVWIHSRQSAITLSNKLYGIKLWYFGKYYNRYKVFMVNNKIIENVLPREDILVQCDVSEENIIKMEQELHYKYFKLHDFLKKNSETMYILNGNVHLPVIKKDIPKL